MREKRDKFAGLERIIESVLIAILIVLCFMMMADANKLQGTSRVINYAGIVRGATQRFVKLEIMGQENNELEKYLDSIILGLKNGNTELSLVRLEADDYQEKLTILKDYW